MDKDLPFETFQFIENSNSNSNSDQLLVVQEDGTLLTVNRDVQYTTQVHDVKVMEDVQTCAVFDVSSQHFYVDVDNTPELMAPDQFSMPHGDCNIYSNSYLIQPDCSEISEPMETEIAEPELKSEDTQQSETDNSKSSKPNYNFTEITLTDAQYHMLEEKGWLLLEFGDKVFVLDALGLHDITTDDKLIFKLKNDVEVATSEIIKPGKTDNSDNLIHINIKHELVDIGGPDLVKVECRDPLETSEHQNDTSIEYDIICNSESLDGKNILCEDNDLNKKTPDLEPQSEEISRDSTQKCDSIKIKTKYTFSDIPDKIFLGKTVNGKKLYAKVTKTKRKEAANMKIANCRTNFEKDNNLDVIDDAQFTNIIQDHIRQHPSKIKVSNVIAADTAVTQLLRIPHLKDTVMGNYVIVTKTIIYVTADGKEKTRRKPITITGEVKLGDDSYGTFVHTPYLLHNMAVADSSAAAETVDEITQEFVEFAHIHTTETKTPGHPSIQSMSVSCRKLSLDVLRDAKKRHPNPIYACAACAAVFKSQTVLEDHLESDCSGLADSGEADGTLTIDTDQLFEKDEYYVVDTGRESWFTCMQCEAKFPRLSNCKKHLKSHSRPNKQNPESENASDSEIKEYKCKMCPSKYFHSSSLSKHIVKKHILTSTTK